MDQEDIKARSIIVLSQKPLQNRRELMMEQRKLAKKYGIQLMDNQEMIRRYRELTKKNKIQRNSHFEKLIRKRAIRTMSGIAPVAVLTKPYQCPGRCVYCPSEQGVPQSYLSNEPAVMRAIRCGYDPYSQVQDRLRALVNNGHNPEKIELIVIGGTWSVLPKKYKYWYVANLFAGANKFESKSKSQNPKVNAKQSLSELKKRLLLEQKRNEQAKYKIIGLTLETRPDHISESELDEMRELGCTRVEIGVQVIDDKILELNKRGHGVKEIVEATKLLKDHGFKVTYHIMPGLPGATPAKDHRMFKNLFIDERFQPDQIKFYPTIVARGSLLHRWWRQGRYRPYTDKQLRALIVKCKQAVPEYVRIIRLIRDIPGESIVAGNKTTNLRQVMRDQGIRCRCIRCRECRDAQPERIKDMKLKIIKYNASKGEENFISYESKDKKILYGFCRLRLDPKLKVKNSKIALVRELHVYGELVGMGSGEKKVQHSGLGEKLLKTAEKIAKTKNYGRMRIISGVGVRGYYRKFGYRLDRTYMEKKLT